MICFQGSTNQILANLPLGKLFTTEVAADYLLRVIDGLMPTDTGGFFAWDGKPIEY